MPALRVSRKNKEQRHKSPAGEIRSIVVDVNSRRELMDAPVEFIRYIDITFVVDGDAPGEVEFAV